LRALLLVYKMTRDKVFVKENFREFLKYFIKNPNEKRLFSIFVLYLAQYLDLTKEELIGLIERYIPVTLKIEAMSTYDQFVQEGVLIGIIQGRQEGMQQGMQQGMEKAMEQVIANLLFSGILTEIQISDALKVPHELVLSVKAKLERGEISEVKAVS